MPIANAIAWRTLAHLDGIYLKNSLLLPAAKTPSREETQLLGISPLASWRLSGI